MSMPLAVDALPGVCAATTDFSLRETASSKMWDYDVVLWVERAVVQDGFSPPAMRVHSANSSARAKMESGIQAIARSLRARDDAG